MGYFKDQDIEQQEAEELRAKVTKSFGFYCKAAEDLYLQHVQKLPQEAYEFGDFEAPRFNENGEAV